MAFRVDPSAANARELVKRLNQPVGHKPVGHPVLGEGHKGGSGPLRDSTLSEDEKRAEREAKNPPV
jgi:hypothetical protein